MDIKTITLLNSKKTKAPTPARVVVKVGTWKVGTFKVGEVR